MLGVYICPSSAVVLRRHPPNRLAKLSQYLHQLPIKNPVQPLESPALAAEDLIRRVERFAVHYQIGLRLRGDALQPLADMAENVRGDRLVRRLASGCLQAFLRKAIAVERQ